MPTKTDHLIAFGIVFLLSVLLHRFVYSNLRRVIVRDFPHKGQKAGVYVAGFFIVMDLPFLFLFFRNQIPQQLPLLSKILLYPFSIWQAIMILWSAILVPVLLWRKLHVRLSIRRKSRLGDLLATPPQHNPSYSNLD